MFYTYILANKRNGTIYTGSTDNLGRRVWQHKTGQRPGFTLKYGVHTLVWYEPHETRAGAFHRERCIKEWRRSWKLMLIEARNPTWRDLYDELHL
jgi:putative endonuclease